MPNQYTPNDSPIPTTSGIYRIVCLTNKKLYIGSAVNLRKRWQDHSRDLSRKTHCNQKLQRAYQKYGSDAFQFEIIEFVLPPFLLEREQYHLDKNKPFGSKGFNIARQAAQPLLGLEHPPVSAETREKLRTSHLGQPGYWTGKRRPPEHIHPLSDEARAKISDANRGRTTSPETREKLRLANLGKKQSEETKHKLREARAPLRGKPRSPEIGEKIRLAKLGHTVSAETIAKIRSNNHPVKTLIVTSPDGTEHTIHGIRQFCKEHNLDRSSLMKVAQGRYPQHKGWKARFPD